MVADMTNPVWIVIIFVVLPPIAIWIRRKLFRKKRVVQVVVTCPHCGATIGLERFRNFICGQCNGMVVLTKGIGSSEPSDDWTTWACAECGADNIQPLQHCLQCNAIRAE